MKILYLSLNDPFRSRGVHHKEKRYCAAMFKAAQERGHVFLGVNIANSIENMADRDFDNESLKVRCMGYPLSPLVKKNKILRRVIKFIYFRKALRNEIKKTRPDVIVFRYSFASSLAIPKKPYKELIYITEHQAKENDEMKLSFTCRYTGLLARYLESIIFKRKYRHIDAIIGVTTEIAKYEKDRGGGEKDIFTFTNGVSVEHIPKRTFAGGNSKQINMLFVQSIMRDWSGVDRILQGLTVYKGPPKVLLHIVGNPDKKYKDMAVRLKIEDKVVFHGPLSGTDLDGLFDKSHVAFGTLGAHRKDLRQASPLKVREYAARGVPFAISYDDEDIGQDFQYVLRLPADDRAVDIAQIIHFVDRLYAKDVNKMTDEIRQYAKTHMDYDVKVGKFIAFIEKVYKKRVTCENTRHKLDLCRTEAQ